MSSSGRDSNVPSARRKADALGDTVCSAASMTSQMRGLVAREERGQRRRELGVRRDARVSEPVRAGKLFKVRVADAGLRMRAHEAPVEEVALRRTDARVTAVVEHENFQRQTVAGDRHQLLQVELDAAVARDHERPRAARSDARTHGQRQVPAHRPPARDVHALPGSHPERLVARYRVEARPDDHRIGRARRVGELVHEQIAVDVRRVFTIVGGDRRITPFPPRARVGPARRYAQLHTVQRAQQRFQKYAHVGEDRDVRFDRLAVQLLLVDVDDHLGRVGCKAREVEADLLHVQARAERQQRVAVLHGEVRAALARRAEDADEVRMIVGEHVFGGERDGRRDAGAREQLGQQHPRHAPRARRSPARSAVAPRGAGRRPRVRRRPRAAHGPTQRAEASPRRARPARPARLARRAETRATPGPGRPVSA